MKNILLALIIIIVIPQIFSKSLTIVFSGSNNGYYRDCGWPVEKLGGLAERKTCMDSLKTIDQNTLFFDTGDLLSIKSSVNDDEIVAGVYPKMGYDAVSIGDQELINGISFFKNHLSGKLPFVSSNFEFTDKDIKIEKYKIIETKNGIRVGVTGVNFNTNFKYLMRLDNIKEEDIIVDRAFDSLNSTISELKTKTDIIVILAHLNDEGMVKLLDNVDGYDLVIGGNNGEEFKLARRIENKVHVQNGRDGEKIGKVVYQINESGKAQFSSYELIKVLSKKYKRNAEIEKIISDLE